MNYSNSTKKICFLKVTTWEGICIGATHYYGSILFNGERKEIKRYGSIKFNSEEILVDFAIKIFQKYFPKAQCLCLGDSGYIEPRKMLVGKCKDKCNKIYEKAVSLGFYNNKKNWNKVDRLGDKWYSIIENEINN